MCEKEIVQSKMKLENFPLESLSKETLIEIIKGYDKSKNESNQQLDFYKKKCSQLKRRESEQVIKLQKRSKKFSQEIKILQNEYHEYHGDINKWFQKELRNMRKSFESATKPDDDDYDSDDSCDSIDSVYDSDDE